MSKITERYREKAESIALHLYSSEDFWGEFNQCFLMKRGTIDKGWWVDLFTTTIAVKLAELERERVVDSEDMVCPQCQKPLTNPDDPCDCPSTLEGKQFDPTTDLPTGEELNSLLEGADTARGDELEPPPRELEDAVACPVCGSSCSHILFSLGGPTRKVIACNNIKCQYMVGSDVAHNTLCADIDKGRRYDRMVLELSQLAGDETRSRLNTEQHLNTAVKLLGESCRCCSTIFDATPGQYKLYDSFCDGRDKLLALDAIKDILKAQEADDA